MNHAASDSQYERRIFLLKFFNGSDMAENPVFSVPSYGTCEQNNEISLTDIRNAGIPRLSEQTSDAFRVTDILLAPESADIYAAVRHLFFPVVRCVLQGLFRLVYHVLSISESTGWRKETGNPR